jgi:hypothetical protein
LNSNIGGDAQAIATSPHASGAMRLLAPHDSHGSGLRSFT